MTRLLWAAGCALFLLLIWSLIRVAELPAAIALFAFALFAAYRPAIAILVVVMLVPIASWTGRHWNGNIAWPETIAVAFLAGYSAHRALERKGPPADAIVYAIHAMIAVIAASLAVEFLFLHTTLGSQGLRDVLSHVASREYFIGNGGFEGGDVGMRLIEGLLLAHAGATLARRSPALGAQLVRALIVGAVLAGAFTVWRLWLGALRTDEPIHAFVRYLATIRFNAHYADVNAAGSYYVLALLPALALTLTNVRWGLAAAVLAVSLSLTGSRAAFISAPLALAIVWFRARQQTLVRRPVPARRSLWVALATLLVLVCAGLLYAGVARNETPVSVALDYRKEFNLTAVRMFASRPVFGVGVGHYRESYADFSSPRLRMAFPNENAHNNFLQILAELGMLGFATLVVLLAMATRRADRLLFSDASAGAAGLLAGLLAFVLTWIAGHPLLIDESSLTFWTLLGAAAGWGTAVSADRRWQPTGALQWIAAILVLVVTVSIPARARTALGAANLEHVGIGLSRWYADGDDIRYRTAGYTSTVFLPGNATVVRIPLRAVSPDRELEVELYLERRQANAVRVSADKWTVVAVPIPPHRDAPRFRALELKVVNGSPSEPALLRIGKVDAR